MRQILSALIVGLIFGLGLTVSQMIDPAKVLAFLDIAGTWDPSLALVMGGALIVAAIGFRWILKRPKPLFADQFRLPDKQDLDARLIAGSALFGVGWGLSGLCPGPALTALAFGTMEIMIFFASMLAGIILFRVMNGSAELRAPAPQDG